MAGNVADLTKNQRRLKALCDKQNGKCYHCGVVMTAGMFPPIKTTATVDHLMPLAKGGRDCSDNRVAACHKCNKAKGNKVSEADVDKFRAMGLLKEIIVKPARTFGF